jgi:hypothetical protein
MRSEFLDEIGDTLYVVAVGERLDLALQILPSR